MLRRFAYDFARFFVDGRGLEIYRLFVTDLHRFPELVRRFHAAGPMAMRGRLSRLLEQMAERGALSIDDPELAAENLAALIRGACPSIARSACRSPEPAEIERRVESALAPVPARLRAG